MPRLFYILVSLTTLFSSLGCSVQRQDQVRPIQHETRPPTELEIGTFTRRSIIAPTKLDPPGLTLEEQTVCTDDKALLLKTKAEDRNVDYYEFQNCQKGTQNCSRGTFLAQSPLIGMDKDEEREISVRACLDSNHNADPSIECAQWTPSQLFAFKRNHSETSTLLKSQLVLRNQMVKTCENIREAMADYLKTPGDKSEQAFRLMVHSHLEYVGIQFCQETLLSRTLDIADALAALEASRNQNTKAMPAGMQPVIQVVSQERALVTGVAFIGLGLAGVGLGGWGAWTKFQNTKSAEATRIGEALLVIEKKTRALHIKDLEYEKTILEGIENELRAAGAGAESIEEKILEADGVIEEKLKAIQAEWRGYKINGQDINFEVRFRQAINRRNAAEIEGVIENLFGDYADSAGFFRRLGIAAKDFMDNMHQGTLEGQEGIYRDLVLAVERKKMLADLHQKVVSGVGDAPSVDRLHSLSADAFKVSRQRLQEQISAIEVSWKNRLRQYTSVAMTGAATGAVRGGVLGAVTGTILGEYILRGPLSGMGGSWLGMKLGVAGTLIGAGQGAYNAIVAKHGDLKGPEWGVQEELLKTPTGRRLLEKDLRADEAVKIRESTSPGVRRGEFTSKIVAAAPSMVGMILAGGLGALGVRELMLVSSAQKDFAARYQKLYSNAQVIKTKYQKSLNELLTGNCSTANL
ncbi:MAG: hypothetical protein KA436_07545 [Oligoflexales bacterium]|nr:hypothetical protein [Oligoflexales bacterium]